MLIGWLPGVQNILSLCAQLAGLVKPNDMQCHMAEIPDEPGVYEYTYSKLQVSTSYTIQLRLVQVLLCVYA